MFKFATIALLNTLAVANSDKPGDSNGRTFNGSKYLKKTAQEKSDMIWEKVIESDESGTWHFAQTLIVDQAPVFKTSGDELECNIVGMCRHKTIHSVGNVAKIQWIDVGGHPYTGVFDGGADFGYVRFSTATPVDTETPNMRPGMGVKFLRDGVDSANFVAMFSVDGQDSLNWFAEDWSNHIPDPISPLLRPLEQRFSTQTNYIQTMGLSDFAAFNAKGERPA